MDTYCARRRKLCAQSTVHQPYRIIGRRGSPLTTNLTANRYFQYRTIIQTDDANNLCTYGGVAGACSPEIKISSAGPTHYDSSAPSIGNATGVPFHCLTGMSATLGSNGCTNDSNSSDATRYIISSNNSTWWYWNGTAWASSNQSYNEASTAAALTSTAMNAFAVAGGTGNLYYKVLLKSDGTHPCEIDAVSFTGNQ